MYQALLGFSLTINTEYAENLFKMSTQAISTRTIIFFK